MNEFIESCVIEAQALLDSGFDVADYDFFNAYGTSDGAAEFKAMSEIAELHPLLHLTHWLYSKPSPGVCARPRRQVGWPISVLGRRQTGLCYWDAQVLCACSEDVRRSRARRR